MRLESQCSIGCWFRVAIGQNQGNGAPAQIPIPDGPVQQTLESASEGQQSFPIESCQRGAAMVASERRRASCAASASSQFRNVAIFGTLEFTFGQTIQ